MSLSLLSQRARMETSPIQVIHSHSPTKNKIPFQSPATLNPISRLRSIHVPTSWNRPLRKGKVLMRPRCTTSSPCRQGSCQHVLLHLFRLISLTRQVLPYMDFPSSRRYKGPQLGSYSLPINSFFLRTSS